MRSLLSARIGGCLRAAMLGAGCLAVASCYDNDYNFTPFYRDSGVVVADFDGDGTLDVAVAQSYIGGPAPHAGYVTIYLQTSPGKFAPPVRYAVADDPWALAAGDLSGTGHIDLVSASPRTQLGVPDTGRISILMHNPNHPGAFLAAQTLATGGGGDGVAIGDLNGDGHPDIVVADSSLSDAHAILFLQSATTPGTFAAPVSLSLGTNIGSNDVAIHDIDGDGRNDIVLATSNGVEILYDNGAGGFLSPVSIAAGIDPQGVAVADVDGDGRPDIVVANAGYSPFGGAGGASVTVLRQEVLGSFAASSINVPDGAVQVVIADLDHDGLPDIGVLSFAFQDFGFSQVSILRQTSSSPGSFSLSASYNATDDASFMAAGDINGDGYTDLVVNNPASVMLQQTATPGTFAAPSAL
jgi:VCBS repeat protein/FG-GAP repeat protein